MAGRGMARPGKARQGKEWEFPILKQNRIMINKMKGGKN